MHNTLSLLLLVARGAIHARTPCGWINPRISPREQGCYHTSLLYSIEQLAQFKGRFSVLPNNHEMLKKVHEDKVEVPNPATDARWLKWLHDSGFDTFAKAANGPTNASPNPDQLADDQSKMTYSFNTTTENAAKIVGNA